MSEKKKEKKPNPTTLLLFVIRCVLGGDKEGRIYYEITEAELESGVLVASSRTTQVALSAKVASKHMGGSAGIVYRVEHPPGDTEKFYTGTAEYVGLWPDKKQRAAWQVYDQTKGQQIALLKRMKKAKADDAMLECLEPIREAYQRARGLQRNLLIARAVQYITRPG